jgi:hypothetical protein
MSLKDWFKKLFSRSGSLPKNPPDASPRPRKKIRKAGAKREGANARPELEAQQTPTPKKKRKKKPASEDKPSSVREAGKNGKKRKTKSAAEGLTGKNSQPADQQTTKPTAPKKAKPAAQKSSAKPSKPADQSQGELSAGSRKKKKSGTKPAKKKAEASPPAPELALTRKKKKKPSKAAPEPEKRELAFGVQIKEKKAERRKAFRVPISSMQAVLHGEETSFTVRDVSVVGIGLAAEGAEALKLGKTFLIDLMDEGSMVAEKMQAKVMRKQAAVVGLMFVDIRRRDEDTLYDIVLREQKRMAERRRKKNG